MVNVADPFLPDAILYVKHTSILQTTLVIGKFMSVKLTLEQKAIVGLRKPKFIFFFNFLI